MPCGDGWWVFSVAVGLVFLVGLAGVLRGAPGFGVWDRLVRRFAGGTGAGAGVAGFPGTVGRGSSSCLVTWGRC